MIFIRHPVTDAPEGMCYGRTDVGLGPDAELQIACVLRDLPRSCTLWSSPALRCLALAEPLGACDGIDVEIREELWELDFGHWEGRQWDDIPRAEVDAWAQDAWSNAPPGGESFKALSARLAPVLSDCPEDAVIVTHAGVIRAARMLLNGETMDEVFARSEPFCVPLELVREPA